VSVIGVGIDAVDVPRLAAMLARRPGLAPRLFTEGEALAAAGSPSRLGARFAAKEAVMKVLGVGLGAFAFHDVEVVREESGAPTLVVRGAAAALARERGVRSWHVSLTHTATLAQAVVIAEE
jgi:holo-[acyl-carrier protein] synthase